MRYEPLTLELAILPIEGIIGSAILVFLVLEGSRRASGFGFVGIILSMAVYIYISPFFSGDFQTRWVSPERLVVYLGLDTNGIISAILQVAVLVVIPFTILGQVLARTGGANFFSDIAMSAMGGFRGGAAKIAVVGSALFGMISGSAVSNVLAVGIVTIPTMIKSGFTPHRAAAIESVGSTGGQLMPPVMGAAAFIMAEFLQVSYGAVCIAATIPAILYYACLFIHVDLEAAKKGIGSVKIEDAPRFRYRGLLLDVARNFQPKSVVLKLLDLMAFCHKNGIHSGVTTNGSALNKKNAAKLVHARRQISRPPSNRRPHLPAHRRFSSSITLCGRLRAHFGNV